MTSNFAKLSHSWSDVTGPSNLPLTLEFFHFIFHIDKELSMGRDKINSYLSSISCDRAVPVSQEALEEQSDPFLTWMELNIED